MEYIKLSYHHLNFEDRTALMLESRKEGANSNMRCDSLKSLMIINKLSKFL